MRRGAASQSNGVGGGRASSRCHSNGGGRSVFALPQQRRRRQGVFALLHTLRKRSVFALLQTLRRRIVFALLQTLQRWSVFASAPRVAAAGAAEARRLETGDKRREDAQTAEKTLAHDYLRSTPSAILVKM